MTLQELKSRLTLRAVLAHYNLTPDKNNRLRCPWHDDKTPSLQLYFKTNTWTCFSSACDAGSGDAIEMCCKMEGDKAKGIAVAKEIVGKGEVIVKEGNIVLREGNQISKATRLAILEKSWLEMRAAYGRSERAQEYVEERGLERVEIGFMGVNFGKKWTSDEKEAAYQTGLISMTRSPKWAGCLVFALLDAQGAVVSLYGRKAETYNGGVSGSHYYLPGAIEGLFPHWPNAQTQRLFLTESIIDAVSLQNNLPDEQSAVLALYGTNGFKTAHRAAIMGLSDLQEIVLCFDADKAGQAATEKYSQLLSELRPELRISTLELPEKTDINSLVRDYDRQMLPDLIKSRVDCQTGEIHEQVAEQEQLTKTPSALNTHDPERLTFEMDYLHITIWGGIDSQVMSRLKVNLQLKVLDRYGSFREDVNLYSHRQTKALINDASEALATSSSFLQTAIEALTEALECYRLAQREASKQALAPKKVELSREERQAAQQLLQSPELVKQTIQLISQSGLVGERKNGLLLFFVYLTRMSEEPLHAIIHGKSGSGKTYLQSKIGGLIPEEAVQMVTGLTENTLYYAPKNYFKHKVLIIEDLDGTYAALYPLREFMSKGSLTKLTTDKDAKGNNVQRELHVEGPVCVSGATTSAQIYEDNANRSYLLEVDESRKHAEAVMSYQRQKKAGKVDESEQESARIALKNAQRLLGAVKVINPYATALRIPQAVFKPLRTNMHYLRLIEIITFYHQQQRHWHRDKNGQLYIKTTLDDIAWANWLVKESLLRKADELSGRLRQFFERLKHYLEDKPGSFFAKDIRQSLRIHPQSLHRNLRQLEKLGLLQQVGYNRKTGFEYEIIVWDDYEKLKDGINILDKILQELREKEGGENGESSSQNEAA